MWPTTFAARLASWQALRTQAQSLPIDKTLSTINNWWFNAPWKPYYLHWDEQQDWPDPWQLLSDNYYCDVARGLGILYTISLLDRADLMSAELVLTDQGHNLVQVDKTKYILNWERNTIVNTNQEVKIEKRLSQDRVRQQYR
jgi:hypothetical protein